MTNPTKNPKFDSVETEEINTNIFLLDEYAKSGTGDSNDKWVVDINDALDDIPDGAPTGVIVAPPGHYLVESTIEMKRGIRFYDDDAATGAWSFPSITSFAHQLGNCRFYLADNVDGNMFEFDKSSDVGTGDNVGGAYLNGFIVDANAANNTTGDILHFVDQPDSTRFTVRFESLVLRRAADRIMSDVGGTLTESVIFDVAFNRATNDGIVIDNANRLFFNNCQINFCGANGIDFNGTDSAFVQTRFRQNENLGLVNRNSGNIYADCHWLNNSAASGTDVAQMLVRGSNNRFSGTVRTGGNGTDHIDAQGTNNEYDISTIEASSVTSSATRPVWNGIIEGGPFQGVDIGSLTGGRQGQIAQANGTTATNGYSLWVKKIDGDWIRVDGGATITPS